MLVYGLICWYTCPEACALPFPARSMGVLHHFITPSSFLLATDAHDSPIKLTDFSLAHFFKVRVRSYVPSALARTAGHCVALTRGTGHVALTRSDPGGMWHVALTQGSLA